MKSINSVTDTTSMWVFPTGQFDFSILNLKLKPLLC